jgi:hypothetical protein
MEVARPHNGESAGAVATETPATTLSLEERLAQYTDAVRQMVAVCPWTDWSQEQRRVYCQKALLDTSRQCLQVIRLYAPTEEWAVPPGAVRDHADALLDHLASWERSGAPEDWRGAYASNLALRDAVKEAALAARRMR